MKTRPYIAYFRVSTTRQGKSGLGLEAQQQAVNVFLRGHGELILESYTEIESGRKNDRPQLAAALEACQSSEMAQYNCKKCYISNHTQEG